MTTLISDTRLAEVSVLATDDVFVTATGVIDTNGDGIAIGDNADGSTLTVAGAVSFEFFGVYNLADAFSMTVTTTGAISAGTGGADGIGLFAQDGLASIAGTVAVDDFAVFAFGPNNDVFISAGGYLAGGRNSEEFDDYSATVNMYNGSDFGSSDLFNAGTIQAATNTQTGFQVAVANAAYSFESPIRFRENDPSAMRFYNSGTVFGDVYLQAGVDLVVNSGSIFGSIDMGADDDRYDGAGGIVSGAIFMGAGEDVARGGSEADAIYGNEDNDLLVGREGEDSLFGGDGEDTLRGGGGEDSIEGGARNDVLIGGSGGDDLDGGGWRDTIRGGSGEDTLDGGTGEDSLHGGSDDDLLLGGLGNFNDTLRGGGGEDTLDGEGGNDILHGGRGDDVLVGNTGADEMTGGAGADVFVYVTRFDAGTGIATRDVITDFARGTDIIDLEALAGVATLDFIGTGPFLGFGQEVRYDSVAEGVDVFIDTNADGTADLRILLEGLGEVTADDFIL